MQHETTAAKAVILDSETTGKNDPIEAIEVAHLELSSAMFENRDVDTVAQAMDCVTGEFSQRYMPSRGIEYGAMATHGITLDMLRDCPPAGEYSLPQGCEYIIGHNVDYDWKVIGSPVEIKRIDTIGIARVYFDDGDSYSQLACLYRVNPALAHEMRESAHGALADVKMNLMILRHFVTELGIKDFETLYQISEKCRIPRTMPFGKHSGMEIANLPPDYRAWALRNMTDLDVYLRRAIEGEPAITCEDMRRIASGQLRQVPRA